MIDLTDKEQLIKYLQSHGLYTKKGLGQNFLVDREALTKIIAAAELKPDDCVLEVGPGLGTLTQELVGKVKKVVAVELDEKLSQILEDRFSKLELTKELDPRIKSEDDNRGVLQILNSDILKVNVPELLGDVESYKVVANIPYYITSKILRLFLEGVAKKPEMIVLLTQKEVAERVCAGPGTMSVLSVSVQVYGRPEIVDIIPRTSFFPAPEVDSAILRITTNGQLTSQQLTTNKTSPSLSLESRGEISRLSLGSSLSISDKDFFRCVNIGFASRRKTLLNNLSAGYRLDKKIIADILKSVGLDENARAQELSVEKWRELAARL